MDISILKLLLSDTISHDICSAFRVKPFPKGVLAFILSLMQKPHWHQQPLERTHVLNPSSNSGLPITWTTGSTTSPSW